MCCAVEVLPTSDSLQHGKRYQHPQSATVEIQDKKFVYKVENGVATSQNITVSPQSDGKNFIVTAGLTPGEVIVTEGVGLMREGTPIKPKGAATTATAPAEQPTKEQ